MAACRPELSFRLNLKSRISRPGLHRIRAYGHTEKKGSVPLRGKAGSYRRPRLDGHGVPGKLRASYKANQSVYGRMYPMPGYLALMRGLCGATDVTVISSNGWKYGHGKAHVHPVWQARASKKGETFLKEFRRSPWKERPKTVKINVEIASLKARVRQLEIFNRWLVKELKKGI